ncbi:HlyD family efflux transporter periplasmic adaptor subunit [Laspinema sp. A4]|uniref:HlyD family efflux transporter periplasmic adaptor subunit n=1 Tax=Laspinema sp. D2d TaxID=2953686 RepID=UPI0021BB131F|nr:HlyD family efflux transporter periplasmic adaptor subunit [Laspinema sp. D2d]MCT7982165.1 HlyD family efflux transporter periplasmic adaptor subunit [Laspinema sp. D2d]
MNINIRPSQLRAKNRTLQGEEQRSLQSKGVEIRDLSNADDGVEELTDAGDRATSIYGGIASAGTPGTSVPNPPAESFNDARKGDEIWSPSLQNLLDQPTAAFPSRVLGGGLAFCLAFAAWAWFGEVNEVGQARGNLVYQGDVYPVHPVELGKVAKIAVAEGDRVKSGDMIAELDSTLLTTEIARIESQLSALEMQWGQKQSAMETTRQEAKTRTTIAQTEMAAHATAIAQAQKHLETTRTLLQQQQEDALAIDSRLKTLEPLMLHSEQLVAQLQEDIRAQAERRERLAPLEEKTNELIQQLETDVTAQGERRNLVQPLEEKTQELIAQLEMDVKAQEERLQRLRPLVQEGALSQEQLFQAEQALRDRQNALIRAQMVEANQAKDRLFEAEQALRDRQTALTRAQMSEATQSQERLFEAEQALRDRQTAAVRSQMSEATQVRERLFEAEQAARTQRQRITETEGQIEQAQGELERLQIQLAQKKTEAERIQLESQQQIKQLELELSNLQGEVTDTRNRMATAKAQLNNRFLYAPVDGVILSLEVSNPGEVVQPGQPIAAIAPDDAPLVLVANVNNRDAGFMQTGMSVQVKFDAYPYQRYGIIPGKVTSISPDTKRDEQLGDVYQVEIALDRNYIIENQEPIYFKPGQTANAEIIIRHQRIADIFLDPIRRIQESGLNF